MIVGLDVLDIHMTSEEAIMIGITLTCCCANGTEHRWKTESVRERENQYKRAVQQEVATHCFHFLVFTGRSAISLACFQCTVARFALSSSVEPILPLSFLCKQ